MEGQFRKLFDDELGRMDGEEFKRSEKLPAVVVLDNIRSGLNVGSIFRTCDAFRFEKIILCGICGTPSSADIHKTALGAEFSMAWEYCKSTVEEIVRLKREGVHIVSVEQAENSTKLQDLRLDRNARYAFIFGNEVDGVQQDVLDMSDSCIEIPQFGTKHSFNVSVSAGIVCWEAAKQLINLNPQN
ncbi:MAG: RNA methyltransferase [Bacteroidales bacterium]|jgi:tRNA G18 (ribose-2'-O)-methylase SpoU|nr:RNA methyltransferase [Bacteroidales bacterium]MCI2122095.1 RNA methyltransferase [Bacteroidales bacterium]MCI2145764.1 RNA methyltransferase [Bacteroidales bacterium]